MHGAGGAGVRSESEQERYAPAGDEGAGIFNRARAAGEMVCLANG